MVKQQTTDIKLIKEYLFPILADIFSFLEQCLFPYAPVYLVDKHSSTVYSCKLISSQTTLP